MKTLLAAALVSATLAGAANAAPLSLSAKATSLEGQTRVRGAICRVGPRPSVRVEQLTFTPLDDNGRAVGPVVERAGPTLTEPNANCAFYSASVQAAAAVQVCADGPRGQVCVISRRQG